MKKLPIETYQELLKTIKSRIRESQYQALKKVNQELIQLYWDMGKMIHERQSEKSWGKTIVETLAKDLQAEFPGTQGFSARNLYNMREFYLGYQDQPNLQALTAKIGWTHNLIILKKISNHHERQFYIEQAATHGWSYRVLDHQIDLKTYQKLKLTQSNFKETLPEDLEKRISVSVKDEYTFDFLGLQEEHSERELEEGILKKINLFLQEMGGVFAYIGNQYKITIEDEEYFIDLLLYHRKLQCLVAIELKIGIFKPEYAGKMQFYLSALNDTNRLPHEKPAIGIILCKSKKRMIVEYALKDARQPMAVGTYTISPSLPKALEKDLPTPEQLESVLKGVLSDEFNEN